MRRHRRGLSPHLLGVVPRQRKLHVTVLEIERASREAVYAGHARSARVQVLPDESGPDARGRPVCTYRDATRAAQVGHW